MNPDALHVSNVHAADDKAKIKKNPLDSHPHVDQFIDGSHLYRTEPERYARFVLCHFRMAAVFQDDFRPWMKQHPLFCTWKDGNRYKVTGASRFGDIWLAKDHDRQHGYDHRVLFTECTDWSEKP